MNGFFFIKFFLFIFALQERASSLEPVSRSMVVAMLQHEQQLVDVVLKELEVCYNNVEFNAAVTYCVSPIMYYAQSFKSRSAQVFLYSNLAVELLDFYQSGGGLNYIENIQERLALLRYLFISCTDPMMKMSTTQVWLPMSFQLHCLPRCELNTRPLASY